MFNLSALLSPARARGVVHREPTQDQAEWFKALATSQGKGYTFIENRDKIPINRFAGDSSYLKAGSKNVWAAFRACHIVASTLLKVPLFVRDLKLNEIDLGSTNGLNAILTHPNPYDSWEELIYQWVFHMKLTGKAFWLKDEVNGYGRPRAIYPLMPQYVRIVPDAQSKIGGYKYTVNGHEKEFGPEEIIYFRRPDPMSGVEGMGDVGASEMLFNEHINRAVLNERFIENGAQPSGVLIKEDGTDDEDKWKELKAWWNQMYSGKRNAGKTAFLNGKWTYQQLGLSSKDQEALEREHYTTESIFQAMGVPLSIAGVKEAANYATAKQDDINFRRYECVPLWDLFVGKMNAPMPLGIVRAFDERFRLDYRIDGLIDVGQVAKDYQPGVQQGAVTPNEMRVAMGLPKSTNPLLDQHFLNGVPIELAGFAQNPDANIQKIIRAVQSGAATE